MIQTSVAAMRPVLAYWSYCLGFGLAGFGMAAVFRNQTGAMVLVLVWPFVLEPIINGILFAFNQTNDAFGELTNLLPAAAGRRSMFDPYGDSSRFRRAGDLGSGFSVPRVLDRHHRALVVGGSVLFIKRDA